MTKNNYRIFNDNDIAWINSLSCLKGESTIPERKKILDDKLQELENKIKDIEKSIDYINWKH